LPRELVKHNCKLAMDSIGGYFGLELSKGIEFHKSAIRLNTGRNALEYILLVNSYKKIYLPYFTCNVLLEPIKKLNIQVVFYSINKSFEPIFDYTKIKYDEAFLYTNYFGLKDDFVKTLSKNCTNLIIDNAQAFYSKPLENIDSFYSPRKFFGVSDGAYLYCRKKLDTALEKDISYERFSHLLRRIDISAEDGYQDFVSNDKKLINQPIKQMSNLTQILLDSIDYNECATIRTENFDYLHKHLKNSNTLKINHGLKSVPMVYPYWCKDKNLREKLITHKIYTPMYWPNVLDWSKKGSLENKMTKGIVYIPIDHRYNIDKMKYIISTIKSFNNA